MVNHNHPVNILLVDDEPANLLALEAVLEEMGEVLVRAASGEEALRRVLTTDFAAILLDVRMPGMSGFDTARLIRNHPRSSRTPILFLTAAPDDPHFPVEQAYELGAVDYLIKPIIPKVLRAKVALFVELHRKSAHLARVLHASEERLRLATEAAGLGVWVWDPATDSVTWENDWPYEILGLPRSEPPVDKAHFIREFIHPDDADDFQRALAATIDAGERFHFEGRIYRTDGGLRWIELVGKRQQQADGFATRILGTAADITKRKQAEIDRNRLLKALRAANERMTEVFRQAPAFMCVLRSPGHVFEMVNERFLDIIGNRDVLGKPIRQALPEIEGQGFFELLDQVYRSGDPFSGTGMRVLLQRHAGKPLDERFVDFVYLPLREVDGSVSGIFIHGIDLSERKRAEDNLRRLAAVVEQSMDFIGIAAPDGRGLFLNPAGRHLTGVPAEAAISEYGVIDFFAAEDREFVQHTVLPSLLGPAGQWEGELRFRHFVSGENIPVFYKAFAVRDDEGGTIALATITRDITEQKRAENESRRLAVELADADRRKTEFLATLAHELRNPLAPIRNGLQIMRLAADNQASIAKVRDMMERQVGHMVHLINDLLDVSRITRGKLELKKERVDLKSIVPGAVETALPVIEAGNHRLDVRIPEEPLPLDADPTRIAQVLSNLLNNAAKYTPSGGRIALHACHQGKDVVVTVSDDGIGIAPESLHEVFDMFTQVGGQTSRAQGGLGIGLSIVKRLVELHGGTIVATSAGLGQGSSFIVRLPLAAAVAADHPASDPRHSGASEIEGRKLRVLVVDDNVDAAESLASLLGMRGHVTRMAHQGRDALDSMQAFRPELVFLDIGLPDLSGHEVAQRMRRMPGMEPVVLVALTGWGAEEDRLQSQQAGFDHHLTKPATLADINKLLAALADPVEPMTGQ